MTRIGTAYFVSRGAAVRYYTLANDETAAAETVAQKLRDGAIFIGEPPLKPGQRLVLIDGGTRYAIEED